MREYDTHLASFFKLYKSFQTFEQVALPSPTGDVNWTLEQVVAALEDNATNQPYRPALQEAVDFIQMENATKLIQVS